MYKKNSILFVLVIICKYVSCYLRVCCYTNWSQYRYTNWSQYRYTNWSQYRSDGTRITPRYTSMNPVSCYLRVCYYTNWSQYRPDGARFTPDQVNPDLCTHIIFAFAKLEGNALVASEFNDESIGGTIGMYEMINNMKKRNPQLKTLLAVGGWNAGSRPFSDLVATRDTRQAFINSTLVFLRQRNFNGLDLDWEYPASRGGRPEDKQNLVAFISELRKAFEQDSYHTGKERLLLTCAVPAVKSNIDAGYDVPNIARNLDFINIMTYDLHGSWDPVTGHNSPLYGRAGESPESALLNMNWAANYWLRNGAPKHRLILGFGLYGRSFKLKNPALNGMGAESIGAGRPGNYTKEAGFMAYYEVCEELRNGALRIWDNEHKCPYLYKDDLWVGYDDEESIREKLKWLKAGGFGGVMIWSLALDDFSGLFCNSGPYPLLTLIKTVLTDPSGGQVAKNSINPNIINALPPVVVSDRLLPPVGNQANAGPNSIVSLPSGLSFNKHNQPQAPGNIQLQHALNTGPVHSANSIVPLPPQVLSPSSEVFAGKTVTAPVATPVLFNVPPSVAQIVPDQRAQNTAPVAPVVPNLSTVLTDAIQNQQIQQSAVPDIGINAAPQQSSIPVIQAVPDIGINAAPQPANLNTAIITPNVQPLPNGNVMQPALPDLIQPSLQLGVQPVLSGVIDNTIPTAAVNSNPPGTVLQVVNSQQPNLQQLHAIEQVNPIIVDSVPTSGNTVVVNAAPVANQANVGQVGVVASPAVVAVPQQPSIAGLIPVAGPVITGHVAPVAPKPKINFSFESSSSSSSNSSSSSSNSSSSSTMQLDPGLSISQAIRHALHGSPSDTVIITELPHGPAVASPVQLRTIDPPNTIIAEQPAIQIAGAPTQSVIPVTSVTNLEELLATLNTNIPTAGAVLLPPAPNNDLTPGVAMQELSLGNVLQSFGSGVGRTSQQSRIPVASRGSSGSAIRTVQSVLPRSSQHRGRAVTSRVSRPGTSGTQASSQRAALAEAIRRNPALRSRIIAARRRALAAAASQPRVPSSSTRGRFRPVPSARPFPVQRRQQGLRQQTTRTRSSPIMTLSDQGRQRSFTRLPQQRSPDSSPVTRRISSQALRRLTPAQLRVLRSRLRARASAATGRAGPSIATVGRPRGVPTGTTRTGMRFPSSIGASRSLSRSVRPTRQTIPRSLLSQFPGLSF